MTRWLLARPRPACHPERSEGSLAPREESRLPRPRLLQSKIENQKFPQPLVTALPACALLPCCFWGYNGECKPSHGEVMNRAKVNIPEGKLSAFCRRHHIRKLAFFGSVLRQDFAAASDVDVLVEFESQHIPGLEFFAMESELSEILGRKVDLHTPQFLSPYFRDQALAEAEVYYVAP